MRITPKFIQGVAIIVFVLCIGVIILCIGSIVRSEYKIRETCEVAMNIDDNPTPLARALCLPRGIKGKLK